jgi:hypothetical protein
MTTHSDFIQNYSRIVATSWVDDGFFNELLADPKSTLDENGLITPDDAEVRVVTIPADETGAGNIEGQYLRWQEGESTGVYELYISLKPEDFDPENVSLSEAQLEAVAGGAVDVSCCCCTPCCCCT